MQCYCKKKAKESPLVLVLVLRILLWLSRLPAKSHKGNVQKRVNDSNIICEFRHMTGNLKDKCYCIHGYPSWHRLFGKPKPKPKLLSTKSSVVANVSQTAYTTSVPLLSSTDTMSSSL